MRKWGRKDPADTVDLWFNWAYFLPPGVTITAATVTVPGGITKLNDEFTDTAVRLRVSGGTLDTVYPITCLIVVDTAETFQMIGNLKVSERRSS